MVDGGGGSPPCSTTCFPHLPRRQTLPEENSRHAESLDFGGELFLEKYIRTHCQNASIQLSKLRYSGNFLAAKSP